MPKPKGALKTFDTWVQIRVRVRHRTKAAAADAVEALLDGIADDVNTSGMLTQEVETVPCECGGQIDYSPDEAEILGCDSCTSPQPVVV